MTLVTELLPGGLSPGSGRSAQSHVWRRRRWTTPVQLLAGCLLLLSCRRCVDNAFISSAARRPADAPRSGNRAAASLRLAGKQDKGDTKTATTAEDITETVEPYEWEKAAMEGVAQSPKREAVADKKSTPSDSADRRAVPAGTIDMDGLPDLPQLSSFDEDLIPPQRTNFDDGGKGLLEWVGKGTAGVFLLGVLAGLSVFIFIQLDLDPDTAKVASDVTKAFLGVYLVMFFIRILLLQFPDVKAYQFPWAFAYYPTEWILAPTRYFFPPEAGVDISPLIWFALGSFYAEFLNGPAGVFTLLQEGRGDVLLKPFK